jgi:DNA-binding YbaB/EbfC family protein
MNLANLMQQAGQLQAKMQKMQEELASLEIEGQSGGGLVTVTLNGKSELKRVRIDPSLMKPGEAEIVEDLVMAAHQDARAKVEATMQKRMQDVAGGLPLPPGFKLF